ncbi:hypothetical protein ACTWPT_42890 [Nonomuraea sp. 3N208]|uniref:hypothetical protein n=1 Tax=Nonomuraea sp. 3N208 TaxID=3457421 RepID=UPI003FD694EB
MSAIAVYEVVRRGRAISAASLRFNGYVERLEANGIPFDKRRVGIATEWHQSDGAVAMMCL